MTPRITAIITDIRALSPTVVELTVARPDGELFPEFRPGQYATLSFPAHTRLKGARSFSMASSPTDRSTLRFGIRIHGRYTTAMRRLQLGDQVTVMGPFGAFIFDSDRDQSAVLIAGGIGVTPFMSMVQDVTNRGLTNNLIVLYSVRSMDDAPYHAELEELARRNIHLSVVYAVTKGSLPSRDGHYVSGRITSDLIAQAVPGGMERHSLFLCGPPAFMKAMTHQLGALGVAPELIRTERFGVGSSALIERGTPIPKFVFASWGALALLVLGVVFHGEQQRRADAATVSSDTAVQSAVEDVTTPSDQNQSSTQVNPTPSTTTTPQNSIRTVPMRPRTMMS